MAIDFENNIICVTSKQLQKINSSGDLIWALNLTKYSVGLELAVDTYGNIYFAETRMSECPPIDHFLFDGIFSYMTCFAIFTKKFSSTGEFLWEKRCTGCSSNSASGIAFDSMNNVYICGVLLIDSLGHIRNDFILFKNPVNVPGICIPIYYDLIIVIATAASLAIIIPTFKYLKKRKLRKDK
ncbi:MAG: hypothetical protein ACFFCL_16280 [Promethearchaeota archaeon]